jgi:hypothetical protein
VREVIGKVIAATGAAIPLVGAAIVVRRIVPYLPHASWMEIAEAVLFFLLLVGMAAYLARQGTTAK